ncbi:MAG: hypothetical protein Sv326_0895 [Candidatus Fermentimicrarchaeum limneticum]|uniref:Yip1 domain-containing protein n=1 Tax=Fermentimicrarchaeum limneticum TaxID=2795018 RepID=A0A7D5XJY9_FERL1|nr:MAG: hypothetical protein Sv326_0895 [Candidatus Fermentimicrarchaeum limneticum]
MKCSKHPDKDAVAVCEKCNLLYCGSCALSSNGKCPACGSMLGSPKSMLPFEMNQEELYKGRDAPQLLEAVTSLYIEPVRTIRRLKQYASLITGAMNVTMLYAVAMTIWLGMVVVYAMLVMSGGRGISILTSPTTLFSMVFALILYFGVSMVSWLVSSAILYFPAKLRGGRGTFIQQACILSYAMLALFPLTIFSSVLSIIPYIGPFISVFVSLAVFVYSIFLNVLIIREVNELNTMSAIISFVISAIIYFILIAVLVVLMFLPLIAGIIGKLLPL